MKLKDTIERLDVHHSDLSGSTFDDVNFSGASLHNVNMSGWHVDDVNLSGLRISNANLAGASITDAKLHGMTINGIPVTDLLAAYQAAQATGDEAADPAPVSEAVG